MGGETTVTIQDRSGKGGPSQEFVLGAALEIANCKNISIASIDTDGTDGPTDAAGGISDTSTFERSNKVGKDIISNLKNHSSNQLLGKLKDSIITGSTDTNVMDLDLAVVLK
jgi:glycerate 2-kinase